MAVCPAVDPLWQQAAHARKKKKHADKTRAKKKNRKKKRNKQTRHKKENVLCFVQFWISISTLCVCVCVCNFESEKKERNLREGDRLAASPFNSLHPSIEKDCVTNEEGSAGCQRDPSGL